MNIRKVGTSDLAELKNAGIKTYLPHYTHMWKPGGVEWYMKRCFDESFLRRELSDPNVEYYIVETDAESIGMMKLVLRNPVPDSDIENALYLEKIYFIKEWTGKGVGAEAIEFVIKRAAALGRECVWLEAMDTAAKPIAAYGKSGFTEHSRFRLSDEFELMKEEFRGMVVLVNCLGKNGN